MSQPHLIPPTESEQLIALKAALVEHGRHSIYCCWISKSGYYDRTLGCTCGLSDALKEEIKDG